MNTNLLTELAKMRDLHTRANERRTAVIKAARETSEYTENTALIDYAAARMAEIEAQIAAEALQNYTATGNKKPVDGVTVKVFTVLKYDLPEALDWARKNLAEALTLDRKLFETHAKGVAKTQPVPVVQIVDEPRVQIASDLEHYLPKAEPAP